MLKTSYPSRIDQQIIYGVIQMLWDRGETAGYVEQLGSHPLPGTRRKQVVLHVALGDHQVSNYAAEMEVAAPSGRGCVSRRWRPAGTPRPSRSGWRPSRPTRWTGNAVVYFDSGTLPPPLANITPVKSPQWIATCGSLDKATADRTPVSRSARGPRRAPGSRSR